MLFLYRFSMFVITAHLPLRRVSTDCCRLQCVILQAKRCLHNSTIIKEEETSYVLFSLIMSYVPNFVICIGMILLYLLQYLICIILIDLSSTFDSTADSIYNPLFMFMIYFWIKIKLKVLLFLTGYKGHHTSDGELWMEAT
jgi:hypothetical protein